MQFFVWLEDLRFSVWIRESPSILGFPFILYLHTLGLALISGLSSAVALAILALPGQLANPGLKRLFPLMWVGLAINALSGVALLLAYPAKAMTNPVFYIKLVAIGAAVAIVAWLEREIGTQAPGAQTPISMVAAGDARAGSVAGSEARRLAMRRAALSLLALWAVAVLTGRLLAYTHTILMAREPFIF